MTDAVTDRPTDGLTGAAAGAPGGSPPGAGPPAGEAGQRDVYRHSAYRYYVRPLYKSEHLTIEFVDEPLDDPGFRAALAAVFVPLGYAVSFGESGKAIYIEPGPARPHNGQLRVETDEWWHVWLDAARWGYFVEENHHWIAVADALLWESGRFERAPWSPAGGPPPPPS